MADEIDEIRQEFNERLDALEDLLDRKLRANDGNGHKVILAKKFYDADEKGILEVTRISKLAAKPLSLALALEDYPKAAIQLGKTTLARTRLDYFFRLQLSGGGWNREMSTPILQESVQAEAQGDQSLADELEAGGGR